MQSHAGLTLSRAYIDQERSTSGYWWVDQLPGVAVVRTDDCWRLLNPLGNQIAKDLFDCCHLRGRKFPSRAEALEALSLAMDLVV